ncbi:hypothetical protein [Roseibium sp. RKSG952]|uniref:hypothetical protein n=1 Tax=Roseibium sp. RKSG952 TaxID=2529384 RepID=UPI0012BB8F1B|nr:hypothetical protein [Roseibium sp. RKSG952]MTH95883.1 hypothetical protein [Roseibium sp. RKSG952]
MRCFIFRFLLSSAILVLTTVSALADFSILLSPSHITNRQHAAIVLEASSTHIAAYAAYPNRPGNGALRTEIYGTKILPITEDGKVHEYPIAETGTSKLLNLLGGAGKIGHRIITQGFQEKFTDAFQLPTPTVRVVIETDPQAAYAFKTVLERRHADKKIPGQLGTAFDEMHSEGMQLFELGAAISEVLFLRSPANDQELLLTSQTEGNTSPKYDELAAIIRNFAMTSDNLDRTKLPTRDTYKTAASWLYQFALNTHKPTKNTCQSINPNYLVGSPDATSDSPVGLYTKVMGTLNKGRAQFKRNTNKPFWQGGGAFFNSVIASILFDPLLIENLLDSWNWTMRVAGDAPIYAEFAVMGDLDPIAVEVARCKAKLMIKGHDFETTSIRERSVIYGTMDEIIPQKTDIRFFKAAQSVTRLVGAGSADLTEYYSNSDFTSGLLKVVSDYATTDSCISSSEDIQNVLPSSKGAKLFRTINRRLFNEVNLPVIRRLAGEIDHNTGTPLFDPRTPDYQELPDLDGLKQQFSPGFVFDLQMVLNEQSAVETMLNDAFEADRANAVKLDNEFTRAQKAIRCIWLTSLINYVRPENPEDHFKIIENVDALLTDIADKGVISSSEQKFSNYWWRVATGMAYVFVLHNATEDQQKLFGEILKKAIAKDAARTSSINELTPRLKDRIQRRVDAVTATKAALKASRSIGAVAHRNMAIEVFMNPKIEEILLFDCNLTGVQQLERSSLSGSIITPAQRLAFLEKNGLSVLARTYEITPGGALDFNANIQGPHRQDICAGIEDRRNSVEDVLNGSSSLLNLWDLFNENPNSNTMTVMKRSKDLRQELGKITPFFIYNAETRIPRPTPPTSTGLQSAVNYALLSYNLHQAKLALLDDLASLSEQDLEAIDPELADKKSELKTFHETAFPADADADKIMGNEPALIAKYELESTKKRISKIEGDIDAFIDPVLTAFKHDNAKLAALSPPDSLRSCTNPDGEKDAECNNFSEGPRNIAGTEYGQTVKADGPAGMLGTALDFHLTATGSIFESGTPSAGRPIYEAELSLMKEPETLSEGACSWKGREQDCDTSTGEQQKKRIPFGIYLLRIDLTDDGRIKQPILVEGQARSRINVQRLRAGLMELGLPKFISSRNFKVDVDVDDADINNIRVKALSVETNINISQIGLGKMTLPIIENYRPVDIETTLHNALQTTIDANLGAALRDSDIFTDAIQFPPGDSFETATFRLGVDFPVPPKNPPYTFDVAGKALTVEAGLVLEAFTQSSEPIKVKASAEVLFDETGISVRSIKFDEADLEKQLSKITEKLLSGFDFGLDGFKETITVLPQFDGKNVSLRLKAGFRIENCPTVIDMTIGLGDDMQGLIEEALIGAAKDFASCQTAGILSELPFDGQEVALFGVTLEIREAEDSSPLRYDLIARGASLGKCGQDLKISSVELERKNNAFWGINLSSLTPEARRSAGAILRCKLYSTFPNLKQYLIISELAVGPGVIAADLQLQDLPFIGSISLGRQNFADPNFEAGLKQALEKNINDYVSSKLLENLPENLTSGEFDLAGIGELNFDATNPIKVILFEQTPRVELNGTLNIASSISADATVILLLRNSGPDIDIRLKPDISDSLSKLVGSSLPMLGDNGINIKNFNVGPLDAHRKRWGIVFEANISIPLLPNNVKINIKRVELSQSGLELDDEIRAKLSAPMSFGPVALDSIIVIYHTGNSDNSREGLTLGADLTFLEPNLARILKIEALLDLREIADLRFLLSGRLIAFDNLALLVSNGDIELGKARMSLSVKSTKPIEPVLDVNGTASLDLPATRISADSRLAILGIQLSKNKLRFCAKKCGQSAREEGYASIRSTSPLLIGNFTLAAETDLALRNPKADGGVKLDLFGWSPGHAGVYADLDKAQSRLSLLGIKITVTTPSIRTMTPELLLRILTSLFDISLEDLLKLKLDDIKITVINGDGSSDSFSDGNSESDSSSGSLPGQVKNEEEGQKTALARDDSPEEERTGIPPPSVQPKGVVLPKGTTETVVAIRHGQPIKGYFCHKIIGAADYTFQSGDADSRFAIIPNYSTKESWPNNFTSIRWYVSSDTDWNVVNLPLNGDNLKYRSLVDYNVYTEKAAHRLCQLDDGPRVKDNIFPVDVKRYSRLNYSGNICENGKIAKFGVRPREIKELDKLNYPPSGLPIACLPSGRSLWVKLYYDIPKRQYVAPVLCPRADQISEQDRNSTAYQSACVSGGVVEFQMVGDFDRLVLTAQQELDIVYNIVRPKILSSTPKATQRGKKFSISYDQTQVTGEYSQFVANNKPRRSHTLTLTTQDKQTEITKMPQIDAEWSLWSHWVEYGYDQILLAEWLKTGRRPTHAFGDSAIEKDMLILPPAEQTKSYRFFKAPSVLGPPYSNKDMKKTLITFPDTAPTAGGPVEFDKIHYIKLLELIKALMPQLEGGKWIMSLGDDKAHDRHLILFESENSDNIVVRIDQYDNTTAPEGGYPKSETFTGTQSSDAKNVCATIEEWIRVLAVDYEPNLRNPNALRTNDKWKFAIFDPENFQFDENLTQSPIFGFEALSGC